MLVPLNASKEELRACAAIPELTSTKSAIVTPWIVQLLKNFNECAADKATLAEKVRVHNSKVE